MVIFYAALEQQFVGDVRELPPRRHIAGRALAGELGDKLNALVENIGLLLARHGDRVLVRVAVNADLVAGVGDLLHLVGEGLDRMAGDEPRCLDAQSVKHLDETSRADRRPRRRRYRSRTKWSWS